MSQRISSAEAAARLGVKRETLYAYVSRGLLESRTLDGKTSTFDPDEVDRLRGTRSRPRAGRLDTSIVSALTHVDDQRVYVRGNDLVALAESAAGFESVASLLWTGELRPTSGWDRSRAAIQRARPVQAALPADTPLVDRLRANVLAASAADPLRHDTRTTGVVHAAAPLIAAMVDGLPGASEQDGSLAARLWPALSPMRPTSRWIAALDAALVVLADHDLAASTFAARIAASTRADPYSVVLAGMSTLAGPLHGGAGEPTRDLLDAAAAGRHGPALAALLGAGEPIPGFGHFHYPAGDPRATALLDAVRAAAPAQRTLAWCDEVLDLVRQRTGIEPNIDFALATLAFCTGMPRDAGKTIFAVARSAGWLAHAIEEYGEAPLRFRPITRYVGP